MNNLLTTTASRRFKSGLASVMIGLAAVAAVIIVPETAQATSGNRATQLVAAFTGTAPNRVAFTPDGSKAYVPNTGTNTVSVIDAQNHKQLKIINLPRGSTPGNLAVAPDGTKVYVLDTGTHSVFIIDTKTDDLASTSTVKGYKGTSPYSVAFSRAQGANLAYVTNNDEVASVSIIDTSTDTQTGAVDGYDGAQGAHGVAFAPDGTFAYVATSESVAVIDVSKHQQSATVSSYTGDTPLNIAITPDGKKAYVTNQQSNSVSVIDTGTHTQTKEVAKFNGIFPADVAANPDGAIVYVTGFGSHSVSVIDVATDTQTNTVDLNSYEGNHLNGVKFRPDANPSNDGDVAYVVYNGSDNVAVIQVHPAAAIIAPPLAPSSGQVQGGTSVTITGKNLLDTTGVTFGGTAGTSPTVVDDKTVTVITPAAPGGDPAQVEVIVENEGGPGKAEKAFTYITVDPN
ncbi:beta-propeller fold lactonase family protein [Phyllobacterium leguminum]|uniref:YVTN family beta-propeller protein n=1 Tax=Phyllobacterium leguminum TaxID=314237 RepID=A0A318T3V6_9HYPH|nr:beta-propeller fold lactonase family protein [Phyllobacterium leguminum]PYE88781.1 YVTN family beta-propeller protein [Phyllobacterium leguminum]